MEKKAVVDEEMAEDISSACETAQPETSTDPAYEPSDISMAIRVDDLTLLECVFHAEAPLGDNAPQSRLFITNPDVNFTLDIKGRRTVCRAMVSVQFGLFDALAPGASTDEPLELMHFGVVLGAVTTVPIMGEALPGARHMAGVPETAEAARDKKMEHMLRLEAIKASYAYAQAKLAEMSAMSPMRTMMLPLIDADELLLDIERREAASPEQS